MPDLRKCDGKIFPQSLQKFDWIFRHSSLFLTTPMAQKPKSSGKSKKAAKPTSPKKKAPIKPKTKTAHVRKTVETNHKASPKISPKAVKLKTKTKTISNGLNNDHEPQRPQVRLPRDAKTRAFFDRQKRRLLDLRDHFLDQMQSVAQDSLRS